MKRHGKLIGLALALAAVAALAIAATPADFASVFGADQCAQIVLVAGTTTYVALAAPGTAHTAAAWQVRRVVVSGAATVVTWADGTRRFVATPGANGAGLAALTYN